MSYPAWVEGVVNMISKQFLVYTQLNNQTVLFSMWKWETSLQNYLVVRKYSLSLVSQPGSLSLTGITWQNLSFSKSTMGMNSVFFHLAWLLYQDKEPILPYCLPIARGRIGSHALLKGILTMLNASSLIQDLNSSWVHFL